MQRQRVTVSQDAAVGSVVTRIIATDADSALNARLVFSIASGDERNAFHVDPLTGVVILAVPGRALDRAHYLLDVTVSDSGQPPLTSSVELTVDVMSQLMTGGVSVSLVFIIVTVGVIAFFVLTIVVVVVVVVVVRHKWRGTSDVERPPTKTTALQGADLDNDALSALFTHLSRSLDARSATARSRDLPVSAATLNAAHNDNTSTWLSSLDCSVVSAPATCQACTLINSLHLCIN